MKNQEWIKFEEKMPNLNQRIEILIERKHLSMEEDLIIEAKLEKNDHDILCKDIKGRITSFIYIKGWRKFYEEIIDGGNEWVKFEDEMPPLDREIEVEHRIRGKIKIAISIYNRDLLKIYENGDIYIIEIDDAKTIFKKWREISVRKPDFSKLEDGDFVLGHLKYPEDRESLFTGFFKEINVKCLVLSFRNTTYSSYYGFKFKNIKKIIRINTETKEFEEI